MATFLSQAQLDYMRAQQEVMIAEIGGFCTIRRPANTPDGYGGYTETFTEFVNVPCRLWISSGPNGTSEEAKFWGEQEMNRTDAFLVFHWDQDVRSGDHVEFDNRDWRIVGLQITDTHHTAIRARAVALRGNQ